MERNNRTFIKALNKKQNFPFLDTMVYKDKDNLQTTLYCKPTD